MTMRREYPNANDEIVERQRQVGGAVLPNIGPAAGLVRQLSNREQRDYATSEEIRGLGRVLVDAFDSGDSGQFIAAARHLAERLKAWPSLPGTSKMSSPHRNSPGNRKR